jgi:CheY-like chemotaxis protein
VEDDPEAALFCTYVLTTQGRFEVTHTADPAAALALAAAEPWDLVITDLDLPVMSGLELLAKIRELAPRVPVVLVTAHVLDGCPLADCTPDALRDCHPDDVLRKPVPADRLLGTAAVLTAAGRAR